MTRAETRTETLEFTDFYRATFHRVAAQLYAYLGDHAEAQDLTQEAFCRALDRWSRVSRYENPAAWVRQVAWNLATSRLRHLQVVRRFVAAQREEYVPAPGPERVDLTRALAALPANHRLAVVLHHVGRLSTSEIARQRGVAEGTVRSWLSRGRAALADQLVDWDQAAAVAPEGGVEAAVAKVRRRRNARRATLAAVLAILVAVPLAILLLGQRAEPPIIEPTPPPSNSSTPSPLPSVTSSPGPEAVETRRAVLPGGSGVTMGEVTFVDRDHAWLWYDPCEWGQSVQSCKMLAISSDGARTWRMIEVPKMPDLARVVFIAVDANTASLQVTEMTQDRPTNYLHTTDGGATFKSYPVERPPAETVIKWIGRYETLCPGQTGMEDGAWGISCERGMRLTKIGVGPVTWRLPIKADYWDVEEGADGRLWLTASLDPKRRLWLSNDKAKTWKELPWPADAENAGLILSPDGKTAWLQSYGGFEPQLWEFVGSQWIKRVIPSGDKSLLLVNADVWLVNHDGAVAYFQNGEYTAIPGVPFAEYGRLLEDGTIYLHAGGVTHLGVGSGTQRQWVRIVQSDSSSRSSR